MEKSCCIIVEKRNAKYMKKLLESINLLHKDYRITKINDEIALPVSFKHVSENHSVDGLLPHISCPFTIEYINNSKLCPSKTKTHFQKMCMLMVDHFKDVIMSSEQKEELLLELPMKWDIHGDLIMFPDTAFTSDYWNNTKIEFWKSVADVFGMSRVAIKSKIEIDDYRSPKVVMKLGNNGIVQHIDNGIKYMYDVTKNMFSKGNITEKLRIASLDCSDEVVVDLFAGIGYFTIPYLLKAHAKKVYACDWNPDAVFFLKHNLQLNKVAGKCEVLQGDNRQVAPKNIADRVNLGLIPSSSCSWQIACESLKSDRGGWLHIHENIESKPLTMKKCCCAPKGGKCIITEAYQKTLSDSKRIGWCKFVHGCTETLQTFFNNPKWWNIRLDHVEYIKSYAPRVDHLVFDFECRPKYEH